VMYTAIVLILRLVVIILSKKILISDVVFSSVVQPNYGNLFDHMDDY